MSTRKLKASDFKRMTNEEFHEHIFSPKEWKRNPGVFFRITDQGNLSGSCTCERCKSHVDFDYGYIGDFKVDSMQEVGHDVGYMMCDGKVICDGCSGLVGC